ncbi:MAG: tRNA preQ1(34) S-adenosylmethionine ribosyltransferase-isomerase QueA [Pseudomonadota bacterium]
MPLSDYFYDLPQALIAQAPLAERSASRLLVLGPQGSEHRHFAALTELLDPDDLLVVNNTRVVKARLPVSKDSGGQGELLLERVLNGHEALAQVRVSKALKPGRRLDSPAGGIDVLGRDGDFYRLRFDRPIAEALEAHGSIPLPPYIDRAAAPDDAERYQTVFAADPGAVAAPTAGLHFDDALLAALDARGIERAEVTLHVGAGTFTPVRGDPAQHRMHSERYVLPASTAAALNACRTRGGRVVAVGTTVVRTLEAVAAEQLDSDGTGALRAAEGETALFIRPGFPFRVIDRLITNFHLPESTLLMLVCAFAGYDPVMAAYRSAVAEGYRFFSYGDAMLLNRMAAAAAGAR